MGHWCILFFIFQVIYNAVISHSGTWDAKAFLKNAVKTQDFALVRFWGLMYSKCPSSVKKRRCEGKLPK